MKKLKSSVAITKLEEYMKSPKWKGKIFMKDEQTCYKDGFKDCFDMVCEEVEAFRHENEKLKVENEALKENKIVLHDLRKDPNDLPKLNTTVIVKTDSITECAVLHRRSDGTYFWSCSFEPIERHPKSVAAWHELPNLENEDVKYKIEDFPCGTLGMDTQNKESDGIWETQSGWVEDKTRSQEETEKLKEELKNLLIEEFDNDKVLTCASADKAKIGTRGWFASDLLSLKLKVKTEKPLKLVQVLDEDCWSRFRNEDQFVWALFYPVEEE